MQYKLFFCYSFVIDKNRYRLYNINIVNRYGLTKQVRDNKTSQFYSTSLVNKKQEEDIQYVNLGFSRYNRNRKQNQ